MNTMIELVVELEKLTQYPEVQLMVNEAKAGEYHDYKNTKYACGKLESVNKLGEIANSYPDIRDEVLAIRKNIIQGLYDETPDPKDIESLVSDINASGMSNSEKNKMKDMLDTSKKKPIKKEPKKELTFSPHLRSVSHKIVSLLREEGVMGSFVLSDGLGMSEYKIGLDIPDWSTFRFILDDEKKKKAGHFQIYMKSKPEETNRTINATYSQADCMAQLAISLINLRKTLDNSVDTVSTPSEFHPN